MKRDEDLVRKIILKVEEQGNSPNGSLDDFSIEGVTNDVLYYHVWLIGDAGFRLVAELADDDDGDCFVPRCLTARGHDFAESIRDDMIWKATKAAAREQQIFCKSRNFAPHAGIAY